VGAPAGVGTVVAMRTLVGAVTVAGMLLLAGCGGSDPIPTLPPTPSATPIFASEEEALAAAEEAYAAYLEMSNLISNEGGVDPERIAPYVTEEQLPEELDAAAYLSDNDLRVVGQVRATHAVLQQYSEHDGVAEVAAYICLDVSDARAVDETGADQTPEDRPETIALEVSFVARGMEPLLMASSEQWSDSSFC
jgi:hypothetical protein